MKRFLLLLLLICFPCQARTWEDPDIRQPNWLSRGDGSCSHASMIVCFRLQDRDDFAEWWRSNRGAGTHPAAQFWDGSLEKYLADANIPYVSTYNNRDAALLDWACSNGLGVGVAVRGATHMVTVVKTTDTHIALIENNDTSRVQWYNRDEFLQHWYDSGSWAVVPILKPDVPPYKVNKL